LLSRSDKWIRAQGKTGNLMQAMGWPFQVSCRFCPIGVRRYDAAAIELVSGDSSAIASLGVDLYSRIAMPSPPLLEIDALIAPIPGDDPAGSPVPFAVNQELEEMRKEIDLESFSINDPMRPEAPKHADWNGILRLTQQTLKETSKDLLVTARLTEALTKVHGFAGFRDGLKLFRALVEQCWDRILPAIESAEDLEIRTARFNWLDDSPCASDGARQGTLWVAALEGLSGWQEQDFGGRHRESDRRDVSRGKRASSRGP
jgi:ImpA, N-terminal, type VI secretion system